MRAVIQRVTEASVTIAAQVKGRITNGLLVLVGVEPPDTAEDIAWLAGKIVRLRIFNDAQGVMNRSVQDVGGDILVISQFTLFASTPQYDSYWYHTQYDNAAIVDWDYLAKINQFAFRMEQQLVGGREVARRPRCLLRGIAREVSNEDVSVDERRHRRSAARVRRV